eukprot:gene15848-biopygen6289
MLSPPKLALPEQLGRLARPALASASRPQPRPQPQSQRQPRPWPRPQPRARSQAQIQPQPALTPKLRERPRASPRTESAPIGCKGAGHWTSLGVTLLTLCHIFNPDFPSLMCRICTILADTLHLAVSDSLTHV